VRTSIFGLIVVASLLAVPMLAGNVAPDMGVAYASETVAGASQEPPPTGQIDVDISTDGGGAWYLSPVWIAIGALALLVIIAIIVAASRGGGGTTVIRG
jgi:hypothetical protein